MTSAKSGGMEMKSYSRPPRYKIWMQPRVHAVRGGLPGNMRQRIRYAIDELAQEPRPSTSDEPVYAERSPAHARIS